MSERRERRLKPSKLCNVQGLEPYVNQNWSADSALDSISDISTILTSEGLHLWNSDERTQALAVATWVAATRQEVGERLLYYGQLASDKSYVVTTDIAEHASMNLRSAQGWLDYADRVKADQDYVLTEDIRTGYPWEKIDGRVSAALLHGVVQISRVMLFLDLEKARIGYSNTVMLPAEFKNYFKETEEARQLLVLESEAIDRIWQDGMNPDSAAGLEVYDRSTRLIEGVIAHGTHALMPRLGDSTLRLAAPVRKKQVTQQGNLQIFRPRPAPVVPLAPSRVPAFDPARLALKAVDEPLPVNEVGRFDPTRLQEPEVVENKVPEFNPGIAKDQTQDTAVPVFDPNRLIPRVNRIARFDPSSVTESTDRGEDEHIPVFDHTRVLDLTPPPLPPQ